MKAKKLHEMISKGDVQGVLDYASSSSEDKSKQCLFEIVNGRNALFLALQKLDTEVARSVDNDADEKTSLAVRRTICYTLLQTEEVNSKLYELFQQPSDRSHMSLLQFAIYKMNYKFNDQNMRSAMAYYEAAEIMLELLCPARHRRRDDNNASQDYSAEVSKSLSYLVKPQRGKLKNQLVNMLHVTVTFGWSKAMWLVLRYKPDATVLSNHFSALHIAVMAFAHRDHLDVRSRFFDLPETNVNYRNQRLDSIERLIRYLKCKREYFNTVNQTVTSDWQTDYDKNVSEDNTFREMVISAVTRLVSSNVSTTSRQVLVKGEAPLHTAVRLAKDNPNDMFELIRVLVREGLNVHVQTNHQLTAHAIAQALNITHRGILELTNPELARQGNPLASESTRSSQSDFLEWISLSDDEDDLVSINLSEDDPDADVAKTEENNKAKAVVDKSVATEVKKQGKVQVIQYTTLPPEPTPSKETGQYIKDDVNPKFPVEKKEDDNSELSDKDDDNEKVSDSIQSSAEQKTKKHNPNLLSQIRMFKADSLEETERGKKCRAGIEESTNSLNKHLSKKYDPTQLALINGVERRREKMNLLNRSGGNDNNQGASDNEWVEEENEFNNFNNSAH